MKKLKKVWKGLNQPLMSEENPCSWGLIVFMAGLLAGVCVADMFALIMWPLHEYSIVEGLKDGTTIGAIFGAATGTFFFLGIFLLMQAQKFIKPLGLKRN